MLVNYAVVSWFDPLEGQRREMGGMALQVNTRRVREAGSLPPPALRTVRETFASHGSSISKAVSRTRQQSYNLLAARYWTAVDSLPGKVAPVEQVHRHLQHLLYRFLCCSRAETPQGSLLAFAPGNVATRIRPITRRHLLFPTPIPAPPLVSLTASLPSFWRERYGLTTFRTVDTNG
jgi:hypothetical protein